MPRKSSKTEPVEVKPKKNAPKKTLPAQKKSPAKKKPAAKKSAKNAKGGSHNPNNTTAKQLEIAMRRERVLDILKSGASYSKIAKLLKSEGIEASKSTVFADVEFLLSDNLKNLELSTEQYV